MKNIPIIIILSLTIMLAIGCDPCAKIKCQNGGVCDNGKCDCPPGYSGSQCQNYDPCYNNNCSGRGVCNNGSCSCNPGYTGTNCETRIECYFNNTGTYSILNNSATRRQYRVVIDGSQYGTPIFGQTTTATLSAGSHSVIMYYFGTSTIACSVTITIVRCQPISHQCNN